MARPADRLIRARLANQRLAASSFGSPTDVVRWMGAVQAQDYPGALWAIGARAPGVTEREIERAFDAGEIVRTHVLRPTWHFVAAEDAGWMLALTAPRIRAVLAGYDRQLGIDARVVARSQAAFRRALQGGTFLTRAELGDALARVRIEARGQRLARIVMHAELDRVICSGPRRGRHFTYALFDERVPPAPDRDRDAALAALARRYFASHGPATIQDFAWWSGLTVSDGRFAVASLGPALSSQARDGRDWFSVDGRDTASRAPAPALLLPNFDEYAVAYKDRAHLVHPSAGGPAAPMGLLSQALVLDGRHAGTWTRTPAGDHVRVTVAPRVTLGPGHRRALMTTMQRFAVFLGWPVEWSVATRPGRAGHARASTRRRGV